MIIFFLMLMSTNSLGPNKKLTFGASQVVLSVISSWVFNLGMDVWAHLDIVYMWSWIFINEFKVEQWGGGSGENSTASDPRCLSFFSCAHLHFLLSVSLSISLFLFRSSRPVYFQHLSQRIDIKTSTQTLLSNLLSTMPESVYASVIYHTRCLWISECLQPLFMLDGWSRNQASGHTLPRKHTHDTET